MKSITRWALANGPAMNIVMLTVIVVGTYCTLKMRREDFPSFDLETILITVPYPGASPEEAEEGVCQKIEEALRSVEGVKTVTSIAAEGTASVVLELNARTRDPDRVLDEVRAEVDRIPSFPEEAEDPNIRRVTARQPAIRVAVLGPDRQGEEAERQLRQVGERVRDRLLQLETVTQVDLIGVKDFQIDVEIPEETLRAHGMSLQQAAEIVRRENRQLPAGTLRSPGQEMLLRGDNRRTVGDEIAELPLVTQAGGAVLKVSDLGVVRDGFADGTALSIVNGRQAVAMSIQKTNSEDMLAIVNEVKMSVAEQGADMPAGYQLVTWGDRTVEVRGRINLLLENGSYGLLLVFLLLAVFLELKLAFWVAAGIPFALLGTGAYLYLTDQTLNMLSMFGFVMALGIVVDDAIVVGENIYAHRQMMHKSAHDAALEGALEVIPSVTASVSTTVIAFLPLLFVSGVMGKFMAVMPVAIIGMLAMSLFECVTVLPCHLAHRRSMFFTALGSVFFVFAWVPWLFGRINRVASGGLQWFVKHIYAPTLELALRFRIEFICLCVAIMLLSFGLILSGIVPFSIFPKLDGNTIQASLQFPDGTPGTETDRWTGEIEQAIQRINQRFVAAGAPIVETTYRVVGQQTQTQGPGAFGAAASTGSHLGSVEVELKDVSQRTASSEEIIALWRDEVGQIPGADNLSFGALRMGPGGIPIEFKLLADTENVDQLEAAVERCKQKLAEFPGVFDIKDDSAPGKWELRLRVKDRAAAMGVRNADLAETVRNSYYGAEVMRLQRGRHEVKLMVRYPSDQRRSLADLQEVRIRTADGVSRPLTEVADVKIVRGYSEINRVDQLRSITVSADIDEKVANASEIVASLREPSDGWMAASLLPEFPNVQVRWEGQQQQTNESVGSLRSGLMVALMGMFVLLVVQFKSYLQPMLVMAIIPFGMIGAVAGHALLGIPLTMFSLFGLVALTGIVVNDSIVLIDFINSRIREGMPVKEALLQSGQRRFRPVMLTTVTTVAGLLPILMERSLQAQVLIPMATSIAFGEIFATILVLYLLPVCYSLYASFLVLRRRVFRRWSRLMRHSRRTAAPQPAKAG